MSSSVTLVPLSHRLPRASRATGRPEVAPECWRRFSEAEEALTAAASPDEWRTGLQIAKAAGVELTGDLKAWLRNLVARGVLLSSTSGGCKLNAGAPAAGCPCG
jgi:hypothetical protein